MPIPNFVPSYNIGLPAALRESLNALGYGGRSPADVQRPADDRPERRAAKCRPARCRQSALAQMAAPRHAEHDGLRLPGMGGMRPGRSGGPGGMGGGAQADFDSLIDLITTTIAPQSWDDVGGPGSIKAFPTNLSLVVSQTQDVHEQIADLLEQLRRLQDLQVTIEVRFITLSRQLLRADRRRLRLQHRRQHAPDQPDRPVADSCDRHHPPPPNSLFDADNYSFGIGWRPDRADGRPRHSVPPGQLRRDDAAVRRLRRRTRRRNVRLRHPERHRGVLPAPSRPGRPPHERAAGAEGDAVQRPAGRSSPTTSQRPFVISVIPVVGDFAAAQQPVIVVLTEGTIADRAGRGLATTGASCG